MKSILIILTVSLATSFSAMALDVKQRFDHLDSNKDGLLTRSESAKDPVLWSRFKSYDSDKDNKLSLTEFSLYANK